MENPVRMFKKISSLNEKQKAIFDNFSLLRKNPTKFHGDHVDEEWIESIVNGVEWFEDDGIIKPIDVNGILDYKHDYAKQVKCGLEKASKEFKQNVCNKCRLQSFHNSACFYVDFGISIFHENNQNVIYCKNYMKKG